jgi:hypothetical protein
LLPQALNMNAATKAVKASLVFIYRYPRNFKDKKFRPSLLFWAFTQLSRRILEGFARISYHFRQPHAPLTFGNAMGVKECIL